MNCDICEQPMELNPKFAVDADGEGYYIDGEFEWNCWACGEYRAFVPE